MVPHTESHPSPGGLPTREIDRLLLKPQVSTEDTERVRVRVIRVGVRVRVKGRVRVRVKVVDWVKVCVMVRVA